MSSTDGKYCSNINPGLLHFDPFQKKRLSPHPHLQGNHDLHTWVDDLPCTIPLLKECLPHIHTTAPHSDTWQTTNKVIILSTKAVCAVMQQSQLNFQFSISKNVELKNAVRQG